jgi:hypothetical protein
MVCWGALNSSLRMGSLYVAVTAYYSLPVVEQYVHLYACTHVLLDNSGQALTSTHDYMYVQVHLYFRK